MDFAEENTVDVREKEIAGIANDANVILNVQGDLEVVPPIPSFVAIGWEDGVIEEYLEAIEIGPQPVQYNDIRRDDEEVTCESGIGFVVFMEEAPRDEQGEDFGFTSTRCHFENITRPILGEHAAGHRARRIETE